MQSKKFENIRCFLVYWVFFIHLNNSEQMGNSDSTPRKQMVFIGHKSLSISKSPLTELYINSLKSSERESSSGYISDSTSDSESTQVRKPRSASLISKSPIKEKKYMSLCVPKMSKKDKNASTFVLKEKNVSLVCPTFKNTSVINCQVKTTNGLSQSQRCDGIKSTSPSQRPSSKRTRTRSLSTSMDKKKIPFSSTLSTPIYSNQYTNTGPVIGLKKIYLSGCSVNSSDTTISTPTS